MVDLFGEVATKKDAKPMLKGLVESGNLPDAIRFVEKLPFDEMHNYVLQAGFTVLANKRDKQKFYQFIGPQLMRACEAKKLPIDQ